MMITKRSVLSGKEHTLDIPVTQAQLDKWQYGNELIQHVMPDLTPNQREFLMSGITPEEWDAAFPEEE